MSAFGVILVRIQSECGKIWTRITPNMDIFHTVDKCDLIQGEFSKFRGSRRSSFIVPSRVFCEAKLFFSWIFYRSKFFSRRYFVGVIFFHVANFVIQKFLVAECREKSDRQQKYINRSKTAYSISIWFQQLSVLLVIERHFI